MRKYINIVLGILLIVLAVWLVKVMGILNKKPEKAPVKIVKTVFVEEVKNGTVPITITANGNLVAKNKIEIFSEVQGVLQPSSKEFRPGNSYRKGEVILKLNSEEHYANLQAQKSNLYNSITSIMPDIRLDYPEQYEKWQQYLRDFDFEKPTPKLPEINSEKEKFFISGRNIYTTFYNVKNMEVRLTKYTIRAPYDGILTDALVNPGSLIRSGQKLGEFINPKVYEMEVAINAKYMDLLQKGSAVEVSSRDTNQSWKGKIARVNGRVDQASQTVKAYIQVEGKDLKEGIYLEAHLVAKAEQDAFEMPRKLLVNNESVYVFRDSIIELVKVNPVYFNDKTVVVKGLEDGTPVLSRAVPGAYPGMKVSLYGSNPRK
ncbi:HlyD family efflux transporter periplasmic adaptor subunit [Lutimonas halocynthiae]|uniref:efflux RND transporter periplasmic adaptor subunit n=1 Tax=Lutimonas halocynthiae TaxID=1446477 RepID=UPI0025B36596|nr:HlyD family efflux transporter periplasmic adaptor subunit [Lutimonas halocynthiae]MDN3643692.1 HlyD family efflux transporter periplasmic adaptor subunit [Lutimonas halocynthiae]